MDAQEQRPSLIGDRISGRLRPRGRYGHQMHCRQVLFFVDWVLFARRTWEAQLQTFGFPCGQLFVLVRCGAYHFIDPPPPSWFYYFCSHSLASRFSKISLLPVLLVITNSLVADSLTIEIEMAENGYPTNLPPPHRLHWNDPFSFPLQIGTIALMARFIRSFTLIAISSKSNCHYFDPCCWLEELVSRGEYESEGGDRKLQASQIPLHSASMGLNNKMASR